MLWLIPIAAVAGFVGKSVIDSILDTPIIFQKHQKSILEKNLERLKGELSKESGQKIAIFGQPGAGKSSLLKNMTSGKVFPLPVIGNETDATDWSEDQNCSLLSYFGHRIFVDIPGYDTIKHPTQTFISYFPWDDFDSYIFVFSGKLHAADEEILNRIALGRDITRIFIARSYSESLDEQDKNLIYQDIISKFSSRISDRMRFFSNRTKAGTIELHRAVCADTIFI